MRHKIIHNLEDDFKQVKGVSCRTSVNLFHPGFIKTDWCVQFWEYDMSPHLLLQSKIVIIFISFFFLFFFFCTLELEKTTAKLNEAFENQFFGN